MTEKLYDTNPSMMRFNAKVIDCREEKGLFGVILNQTAFFPEEGGQYADIGTLNNIPVEDVKIKNGIITHYLKAPMAIGDNAEGSVDWIDRFDKMQQHSGEHIISGLIHRHFGFNNVGFHLGKEEVTLDFNGILSKDDLLLIEKEANEAIYKNLDVQVSYPPEELLKNMQYRSKIEIDGPVRIVEIPGYDICACCAPHVQKTGEIGMIKITGLQNYKGGIRLNILCGQRALADYGAKLNDIQMLSVKLSAKPALVVDAVMRLETEIAAAKERLIALQQNLLQLHLDTIPECAENTLLFEVDLDTPAIRKAVNQLSEKHPGYNCIFAGNDENGYRYMIGSSQSDCRQLSKLLSEKFSAKGGGSAQMVQGSLKASKKEIERVLNM